MYIYTAYTHIYALLVLLASVAFADQDRFAFVPLEDDIIVKYEKKPPQPVEFHNYHQFTKTPFQNSTFDSFLDTSIDESTAVTFRDINNLNELIRPVIKDLVGENFFRIFRLNLYKECPFWKNSGFCMHRSCAVDTIENWDDLPEIWQPENLGKLQESILVKDLNHDAEKDGDVDNEYCDLDGFIHDTVYVDLVANPERFTGYGGDQSWQIWKSIYNENCFNLGHDQCVEKNFFYKMVSGMHASIATHLSNEYLDKALMDYSPSLEQFMIRVGDYPDRIANLYLNYVVVLKALIKLETRGVFEQLTFSDDLNFVTKENTLKQNFKKLLDPALEFSEDRSGCMFEEDILFTEKGSLEVKEEIRQNFKNITRIMDCVHCDRCRLWGKLQTTGYGTALKVLFELQDSESNRVDLSNIELIALVNTFDRLSKSVESINSFKAMFDEAILREESGESETYHDTPTFGLGGATAKPKAEKVEKPEKPAQQALPKTPDLFKKEQELYEDVIFPSLGAEDNDGSLRAIFFEELDNVLTAIKWLLKSYYIFPKIIYNWCLIRIVYYWNTFIGHVDEDFDFNRLYTIII